MRISSIILKPIVTEKSMSLSDAGRYVFQVTQSATAGAIKRELKKLYGVDVIEVKTIILPGKKKRRGKTAQFKKTAQRKKLIVTLKKGQKIEVLPKETK